MPLFRQLCVVMCQHGGGEEEGRRADLAGEDFAASCFAGVAGGAGPSNGGRLGWSGGGQDGRRREVERPATRYARLRPPSAGGAEDEPEPGCCGCWPRSEASCWLCCCSCCVSIDGGAASWAGVEASERADMGVMGGVSDPTVYISRFSSFSLSHVPPRRPSFLPDPRIRSASCRCHRPARTSHGRGARTGNPALALGPSCLPRIPTPRLPPSTSPRLSPSTTSSSSTLGSIAGMFLLRHRFPRRTNSSPRRRRQISSAFSRTSSGNST